MRIDAELSFVVAPLENSRESPNAMVPAINGSPLADLIAAFERDRDFDPAGTYAGLVPQHFNFGLLERYFMGEVEAESYWDRLGGIYVLGCECGEVGCWPLFCRVSVNGNSVIWNQFAQPHRPERDYSDFGPFAFKLEQYRRALSTL